MARIHYLHVSQPGSFGDKTEDWARSGTATKPSDASAGPTQESRHPSTPHRLTDSPVGESRHPPTHRLAGRGIQTPTDSPTRRSEQSARASAVADVRRSNAELLETRGACAITSSEKLYSSCCRDRAAHRVERATRPHPSSEGVMEMSVLGLGIKPLAYRKAVRAAALP